MRAERSGTIKISPSKAAQSEMIAITQKDGLWTTSLSAAHINNAGSVKLANSQIRNTNGNVNILNNDKNIVIHDSDILNTKGNINITANTGIDIDDYATVHNKAEGDINIINKQSGKINIKGSEILNTKGDITIDNQASSGGGVYITHNDADYSTGRQNSWIKT